MPRVLEHPALKEPLVFPDGTSDIEIYSELARTLFPKREVPPPPPEEAGFFGGLAEGITSLGAFPPAVGYAATPEAEQRKALVEATRPGYDYQQVSEIEGIGDLGRFLKEQGGYAVGAMAAPVAAAKAASMIPAPLPAKVLASGAAFITTGAAQYIGQTLGRQAQEQEIKAIKGEATEAPEITKALLSSGSQAGLDLVGFRIFKPLGQLIGLSGKEASEKVGRELIDTAQREGTEAAARSLLGGAAKGAAIEAAQEPIQQLLERWGAGLDLSSDEAIKEYFEAAVAGGLLGAPIGGASTFIGNLRDGVYDKKFDSGLNSEQAKEAWAKNKNEIFNQVPDFEFQDSLFTPAELQRMGIQEGAKDLRYIIETEKTARIAKTLNIESDILGKSVNDPTTLQFLSNVFAQRLKDIDRELVKDGSRITPDERAELVGRYEQASSTLKGLRKALRGAPSEASPQNFGVAPSPKTENKFVVVNEITGQPISTTEYDSVLDAEKEISKLREKEFNVEKKETEKTVEKFKQEQKSKQISIPTGASAETQALTNRLADIQKAFGENANRVFERAKEYQDAGYSKMEALEAAEKDITVEIENEAAAQKEEKAAAAAAKPTTPKVGFKTEKGSLYSLDEQGRTSRTKLSEGKGKGTTYPPHSALYVTPEDAQSIMEDMQSGALDDSTSIRLGYIDAAQNKFINLTDVSKVPEGVEPIVAVVDTKQNKLVGNYPAKIKPEVGLSPIEKLYKEDGTSSTHVGNKIVELFGQPKPTKVKEKKTKKEPPPPPPPPPTVTPEEVEANAYLDNLSDEMGYVGLAHAIKPLPLEEKTNYINQIKETLAEIEKLEVARKQQGKDTGTANAIRERIRKLENSLEDMEYGITNLPNTREQIQKIISKNGNAKEANEVSQEVKTEVCKGGSDGGY